MSPLSNQLSDLDAAWKLLQQRWQATGEVWNDRVYEEFAAQHMEPLAQQTQAIAHSPHGRFKVQGNAASGRDKSVLTQIILSRVVWF